MTHKRKHKISWSAFDRWQKCPHMYYLYHIKNDGQGYEIDQAINRSHTIHGSVIQEVFSRFLNDRLWKKENVREYLSTTLLDRVWNFCLSTTKVDWEDYKESSEEVYNRLKKDIEEVYDLLIKRKRDYNFKTSRSETKVTTHFRDHYYLTGKIDFFINLKEGKLILDGKATSNVNDDQLLFYALMYYKIFKKYPAKLGYLYYLDRKIQYIDFTPQDVSRIENALHEMLDSIESLQLPASPSESNCKFCLFKKEHCEYAYQEEKVS